MRPKSVLLLFLVLSACTQKPDTQEEELYSMLQGTFTSEQQSQQDSTYYDITLQLTPFWEEKEGYWLYAEYALTKAAHQPYTQRIFEFKSAPNEQVEMLSYDLEESYDLAGKWNDTEALNSLHMDDLTLREGCSVFFNKSGERFVGETVGKNCKRQLGKAVYSTHEITVTNDTIVNWARGYNEEDQMVWGTADGGYVLVHKDPEN